MPIAQLEEINLLIIKKDFVLAEKKIKKLIKQNPTNSHFINLLAIIYIRQNRLNLAISNFKKIITINPDFKDSYTNLHTLIENNYTDIEGFNTYNKIIKNFPKNIKLLAFLCTKSIILNKTNKAKKLLKKIIALNKNNSEIYFLLGMHFLKKEIIEQSLMCFNNVLNINAQSSKAYSNIGVIYSKYLKDHQGAIKYIKKSINIDSKNEISLYNLGLSLTEIGKRVEANQYYKKALAIKPNYIDAAYNLSLNELSLDNFKKGWDGYELRKQTLNISEKILDIPVDKIWNGEKTSFPIVVHAEQGLGEEIMISSLYNDLLSTQKNLHISCDKRLLSIFERSFPKINFFNRKNSIKISSSAMHIFSFSLGQYLRKNTISFQRKSNKYLLSNSKIDKELKEIFSKSNKFKIGISWKSPNAAKANKNISLLKIASLLPQKDFELINLQYGDIQNDQKELFKKKAREILILKDTDYTKDIEKIFSIINNCDLVITSSNVTAHFAGALGKTTLLILPLNPLWHWQVDKNYSIWYPSIKIFRQSNLKNWEKPLRQVKNFIKFFNKNE